MSVRKKYGLAIMVAGFAALLCFFFAPDAYNPFVRTVALKGHTPTVVGEKPNWLATLTQMMCRPWLSVWH